MNFNLTLEDLIGDEAKIEQIIDRFYLCNNGLIFKMNYICEEVQSLDIVGKLDDDVNNYTLKELHQLYTENDLFTEFIPQKNQILTEKFYNKS